MVQHEWHTFDVIVTLKYDLYLIVRVGVFEWCAFFKTIEAARDG